MVYVSCQKFSSYSVQISLLGVAVLLY
uniref:Uncharacterized protein n=1 Tax=Anguilla anguilla TaxID=7936 RepID=A0A0E9TRQ4_ANGAN